MLHAHGLAGAHQGAIKHGCHQIRAAPAPLAQVVAPVRDTLVPVRHHERKILFHARGHHQLSVVVSQTRGQIPDVGQHGAHTRAALRIGGATEVDFAKAILNGNQGLGYRQSGVERSHPNQ